jgi:hypothetical protein
VRDRSIVSIAEWRASNSKDAVDDPENYLYCKNKKSVFILNGRPFCGIGGLHDSSSFFMSLLSDEVLSKTAAIAE